jgi:hypothetical protein
MAFIRYENGKKERYHTAKDPLEWDRIALNGKCAEKLSACSEDLLGRIPRSIPEPEKKAH